MNVNLCSSSHSYPTELANTDGIHLHLVDIMYIPELSPRNMWYFLTCEKSKLSDAAESGPLIGMGGRLARLCISVFGGNVALIEHAIQGLEEKREHFRAFDYLKNLEGAQSIKDLVQKHPDTKELLKKMAKNGYVLTSPYQTDVVNQIVSASIAGVVERQHVIDEGELRTILQRDAMGTALVPSSEALRHMICFVFKDEPTSASSGSR